MYWNKFLAKDNFILAWERINTGTNTYYKRFFREVYLAYEISHKANIENLIDRIKHNSFKPCEPDKIYKPKPSGFLRPITLLSIEDQIVWQALVNILEKKFKEKRFLVERKTVFSNLSSNNPIFFFENWKSSYSNYKKKIIELYQERKWVAHFDLAAFFDTISHDHILNLLNSRNKCSEISIFTENILNCWTSEKISFRYSHGIPQGPIASSYIGELIFLKIDLEMMRYSKEFSYLRYVDDIRLLAKSEDAIRKGMVILEQLCRNMGLIPQSKKTNIFLAKTDEEAIGKDVSLIPEDKNYTLTSNILKEIIDFEKIEIKNITKFKFYLHKTPPSEKYIDILLKLFDKYPELSDIFYFYFIQMYENKSIINHFINLLKNKNFIYEYVEGNIWLVLSQIEPNRKSSNDLLQIAINKILNSDTNLYLRYGLLLYLSPFNVKLGKKILNKFIYEKSSLVLGLLLANIAFYFDKEDYIKILKIALIRTKPEAGLIAVTRLAYDNLKYHGLKIAKKIKSPVRNTLVGLGLTSSQSIPEISPFQEVFKDRYKINIDDWKIYLEKDYSHAHKIFIIAEKGFNINPSSWLCNIDSFNEIIIRALIKLDKNIIQKTIGNDGKLVKYGTLIDLKNPISKKYIYTVDVFRLIHKRRCRIPEAHPFDEKTAQKAQYLKQGERNNIWGKLKQVYEEVNIAFKKIV